ncbi:hypothetical protein Athai_35300 [Actinocatenispora thailandica]|uniref:Lipoprotein LpqN n=2 Tax=Actinocatenispora thailandica TaxID=227318 RepID=A0A7R7DQR2_9ACTN|nr:hypothetical protein Athai_35300 [Actinocatenispora thailandica]
MRTLVALLGTAVLLLTGCGTAPRQAPTAASTAPPPTTVTFRTPTGFRSAHDYTILVPLTPHGDAQWRVPSGEPEGLDVIFVESYVLSADSDRWSDARKRRQIHDWAGKVHATRASEPTRATVAGLPAYQQRINQPDGDDTLRYDATFVFTGRFLVQVGCQWDQHPTLIRTACRQVLATLTIGAV